MYSLLIASSRHDPVPGSRVSASLHLPQRLSSLIHTLIAHFGYQRSHAKVS